jgi:nucleoside-diphosphate-sugar epimerase
MTIFVTGATGYIGSAVAQKLLDSGYTVTGLARSPQAAASLEKANVRPVSGSLEHPESLVAPAREAAAVVHTAIAWGPNAGRHDQAAVQTLIAALEGTDKPLVYTSGVWVMGDTKGRLAGEMFPLHPPPLVAWRPAVERMIADARERKVCGVTIRPAIVYGRGGGLIEKFRVRRLPFINSGGNYYSFVHIDDLAGLYVAALERAPAGSLYVAAHGPAIPARDIAAALGISDFLPFEKAREQFGPIAEALILDQKIGSTRAFRELGWRPAGPPVFDEIRAAAPA